MWRLFGGVCLCLLVACGSAVPTEFDESVATQLAPVVTRVAPAAGKGGDTINVFGLGFSAEAAQNIVLLGGAATAAATYGLVNPAAAGEIEQLTFTVPASAALGATTITVTTFDRVSNSDVAFTVTP